MNESIIENVFSSDELHRFSKSDFRWAENRKKKLCQKPVKKGEIYQFEFGKNYIPEMSYEHTVSKRLCMYLNPERCVRSADRGCD